MAQRDNTLNNVWDVNTLQWVRMQQPILNAGSVTVSGSITANAGTNLNTSALALEAGGNLATLAGKDFATSAKQPSLGTAGSASANVITVQGISAMTPLIVSGAVVTF